MKWGGACEGGRACDGGGARIVHSSRVWVERDRMYTAGQNPERSRVEEKALAGCGGVLRCSWQITGLVG